MTLALFGERQLHSDCIQQALLTHQFAPPPPTGMVHRPASVLLPLLVIDQQWHLLYIRRSEHVHDHKGQVAFPGGAAEEFDPSVVATSLRETEEEIGIATSEVQILGQMGQFPTVTHFLVNPVVGIIPWPYPLRLQTEEVVRAFPIPLYWLADPANRETRPVELHGQRFMATYYNLYEGEMLWGISAQITLDFLNIIQSAC